MSFKQTLNIIVLSVLIKILLVPAYFSTDFDVHRNWIRITHNQPITKWYTDTQSLWTLDYPPFFAYFQYFISLIGSLLYPDITSNMHLECQSKGCVLFQRITVILSQFVYLAALVYCLKGKATFKKLVILFLQYGFVLLDDVHFQYNSMMQGILIFSIEFILRGRVLLGALTFSTLLNFKHIYFYVAPVYFIYILKHYVLQEQSASQRFRQLLKVAGVTLIPFILSFGPFVLLGGIQQISIILSRLFPFGRGLVHSYWAANFWAFYCALDRFLASILQKPIYLIQGYNQFLRVLPQISPVTSLLCVLTSSMLVYKKCFESQKNFVKCIILSGLLFCFFGYHVHQKAFLVYINLLLIYGGQKYWNEVLVNSVSLMPLLHRSYEKIVKILGLVLYMGYWKPDERELGRKRKFILITGGLVLLYHEGIHPFTTLRYYFLPLMMYSLWTGFFYTWTIIELYMKLLRSTNDDQPTHQYQKVSEFEGEASI